MHLTFLRRTDNPHVTSCISTDCSIATGRLGRSPDFDRIPCLNIGRHCQWLVADFLMYCLPNVVEDSEPFVRALSCSITNENKCTFIFISRSF